MNQLHCPKHDIFGSDIIFKKEVTVYGRDGFWTHCVITSTISSDKSHSLKQTDRISSTSRAREQVDINSLSSYLRWTSSHTRYTSKVVLSFPHYRASHLNKDGAKVKFIERIMQRSGDRVFIFKGSKNMASDTAIIWHDWLQRSLNTNHYNDYMENNIHNIEVLQHSCNWKLRCDLTAPSQSKNLLETLSNPQLLHCERL